MSSVSVEESSWTFRLSNLRHSKWQHSERRSRPQNRSRKCKAVCEVCLLPRPLEDVRSPQSSPPSDKSSHFPSQGAHRGISEISNNNLCLCRHQGHSRSPLSKRASRNRCTVIRQDRQRSFQIGLLFFFLYLFRAAGSLLGSKKVYTFQLSCLSMSISPA